MIRINCCFILLLSSCALCPSMDDNCWLIRHIDGEQSVSQVAFNVDSYGNDCSKVGLTAMPSPQTGDIRCAWDAAHPWKLP